MDDMKARGRLRGGAGSGHAAIAVILQYGGLRGGGERGGAAVVTERGGERMRGLRGRMRRGEGTGAREAEKRIRTTGLVLLLT
jgi:hypothetical protein